jgi:hypothetical protein
VNVLRSFAGGHERGVEVVRTHAVRDTHTVAS